MRHLNRRCLLPPSGKTAWPVGRRGREVTCDVTRDCSCERTAGATWGATTGDLGRPGPPHQNGRAVRVQAARAACTWPSWPPARDPWIFERQVISKRRVEVHGRKGARICQAVPVASWMRRTLVSLYVCIHTVQLATVLLHSSMPGLFDGAAQLLGCGKAVCSRHSLLCCSEALSLQVACSAGREGRHSQNGRVI